MKIERNLNAWGNIVVKVITDEDIEDMSWAAVIEDHGDEYLVVKMKDGRAYKYGCFANLKDSEYILKNLSKQPEMFRGSDRFASLSNKIYELVHFYIFKKDGFFIDEKIKEESKASAQYDFDHLLEKVDGIFDSYADRYDCNYHKDDVIRFLKLNGIDTEENLNKLNETRWDSKTNGIDGYAGKRDLDPDVSIYFDSLVDTYNVSKAELEIVKDDDDDEWGVSGYYLNLIPDPILNANKKLYEAIDNEFKNTYYYDNSDDGSDDDCYTTKWQDWMNSNVVDLKNGYKIMFDNTTIHDDVAYYLIIRKGDPKPVALYATLEESINVINN